MDGIPKIADLGIAKAMKTEGLSTKIGTMFYASQEFLNEERYDFPADIWSLGIIFWEMLSGKRINQVIKGLLAPSVREGFPSDAILNEIKEEDLRELVRKMLVKEPANRLDAKDVLKILSGNKVQTPEKDEKKVDKFFTNKIKINPLTKDAMIDERE